IAASPLSNMHAHACIKQAYDGRCLAATHRPWGQTTQGTSPPASVANLWPTDARRGSLNGQHLARAGLSHGSHVRRTTPLGYHHEQRSLVRPPERACEAAAVQVDGLQHLTAFTHAHATPVGDVPVPVGVGGLG